MGSLLRSTLIKWCKEQEGTEENPMGSNRTIYGELVDRVGLFCGDKNGIAWCGTYCEAGVFSCVFDDTKPDYDDNDRKWDTLFFLCQPASSQNYACACKWFAKYMRDAGAWHGKDDFEEGDIVFFGNEGDEYHQGIVVGRPDDRCGFYSSEGNHNNRVETVWHDIDENISGFGRPRYDAEPDETADPVPDPKPVDKTVTVDLPVLYKGIDAPGEVYTIQALLKGFGFKDSDGNEISIDGIFGTKTEQAVRSYQEARGLEVCGIVNAETWNRILK